MAATAGPLFFLAICLVASGCLDALCRVVVFGLLLSLVSKLDFDFIQAAMEPKDVIYVGHDNKFTIPADLSADRQAHSHKLADLPFIMSGAFEGAESESNWRLRENFLVVLRMITNSYSPGMLPPLFLAQIRQLVDGICKGISSLRTSLSTTGCKLISTLAEIAQTQIDNLAGHFIPTIMQLSSHSKTISRENSIATITSIFTNVSFGPNLLNQIFEAAQHKNPYMKFAAAIWLETIVQARGEYIRDHYPSCSDTIFSILSVLLKDPKPNVREEARKSQVRIETFWPNLSKRLATVFPTKGKPAPSATVPPISTSLTMPATSGTTTSTTAHQAPARPANLSRKSLKDVMKEKKAALKETKPDDAYVAPLKVSRTESAKGESLKAESLRGENLRGENLKGEEINKGESIMAPPKRQGRAQERGDPSMAPGETEQMRKLFAQLTELLGRPAGAGGDQELLVGPAFLEGIQASDAGVRKVAFALGVELYFGLGESAMAETLVSLKPAERALLFYYIGKDSRCT